MQPLQILNLNPIYPFMIYMYIYIYISHIYIHTCIHHCIQTLSIYIYRYIFFTSCLYL